MYKMNQFIIIDYGDCQQLCYKLHTQLSSSMSTTLLEQLIHIVCHWHTHLIRFTEEDNFEDNKKTGLLHCNYSQ